MTKEAVVAALKRCGGASSYKQLHSLLGREVGPVLEKLLRSNLVKPVRDDVVPDECSPEVASLRAHLLTEPVAEDDVWFYLYQFAAELLDRQSRKRSRDEDSDSMTTVVTNCFVLFCRRGLPDLGQLTLRWGFLMREKRAFESSDAYVNGNASERRKLLMSSVLCVFSERAHKHYFSAVWMKCIERAASAALHIHLLHVLGPLVLPNLTNPLVAADYLSGSFGSGGLVSVLALRGLLVLMLDHGLEYPQYYEQLYSLVTADAFASRHRYELFRLLDLSLSSPRVPSYIAASFVKRIAVISLAAPAPSLYFTLPFIRKVFQVHPNCLALIHRTTKEAVLPDNAGDDSDAGLAAKRVAQRATVQLFEGKDPFLREAGLRDSHALNSTLWELTALERHYLSSVPLMVSAFSSAAEDKAPLRYEKTYGRLFTSEVTRPISKENVPSVAYHQPKESNFADLFAL